jgi:hypothetical protein
LASVSRCKGIDLTPNSRESVLYRYLSMFMSRVMRRRLIYDDVFVRRKRQPDVDLKSGTMAMLVAWRDQFNAATGNTMIVGFQSLYFT